MITFSLDAYVIRIATCRFIFCSFRFGSSSGLCPDFIWFCLSYRILAIRFFFFFFLRRVYFFFFLFVKWMGKKNDWKCVRVFMRYSYGSLYPSGVLSACLCASSLAKSLALTASRSNAACFKRYLRFSSPKPYSPATAAILSCFVFADLPLVYSIYLSEANSSVANGILSNSIGWCYGASIMLWLLFSFACCFRFLVFWCRWFDCWCVYCVNIIAPSRLYPSWMCRLVYIIPWSYRHRRPLDAFGYSD